MKTSVERAAAIVEIQQLAARYSLGVDSRDMEAVASLYVDDVHAGRAGRGRDALQQRYEENDSQFGRSVSTVTNHVVDIVDDDHATGVVYLRMDQQIEDGSWATFHGGPGDLSTTIEAYLALRLAGDAPDAPHLAAAARFVREHGGLAASRVFTRFWLALFGHCPSRSLTAKQSSAAPRRFVSRKRRRNFW